MTVNENRDMNRDPITGTPGSHPLGTGVGAAGGAVAGAAVGAIFLAVLRANVAAEVCAVDLDFAFKGFRSGFGG